MPYEKDYDRMITDLNRQIFIRDLDVSYAAGWGQTKLTNTQKLYPDNIEKVIFNDPATIVIFTDGTKEVVKCAEGDTYSEEIGFLQAMANIMFRSRSNFKRFIKNNTNKQV